MANPGPSYEGDIELSHSRTSVESILGRLVDPYQSDSLTDEAPVFIPSLQREFCWGLEDIEDLFDSLLRGLPIGTLLLWNATADDADPNQEAKYKFIRHYANRSNFPNTDAPETVNYHSEKVAADAAFESYTFALDGQQRLTSFLIALRGSFYDHRYRKHTDKFNSYHKKQLCLDLLTDPDRSQPDDAQENIYRFEFRRESKQDYANEADAYDLETDEYWFPINAAWRDHNEISVDGLLSPASFGADELPERVAVNLERLERALTAEQIPCEEVRDMVSEEALELFVRRNKGGEELSNSDIAFSLITVYWDMFDEDGSDPKDIFESRASQLTSKFSRYSFGFGKGFLIRSLLYLKGEKPSFEQDNLVPETISPLEDIWGDSFFDTVRMAFNLVTQEFGLTAKCLTGKTALLPIMQYCWEGREELDSYTDIPSDDRRRMEYWLQLTVLNNIFNVSSSMSVLTDVREYVAAGSFNVAPLLKEYRDGSVTLGVHAGDTDTPAAESVGRSVTSLVTDADHSSRTTARNYFLTKLYAERGVGKDFDPDDDAITPLEIEAKDDVTSIEIDHFYPAGKLRNKDDYLEAQLTAAELDAEEIERIISFCDENVNQFANFTLLPHGAGNQSKGEKDPEDWLSSSGVDRRLAKEIHHLPDAGAYTYPRYEEFLEQRQDALINILETELVVEHDL